MKLAFPSSRALKIAGGLTASALIIAFIKIYIRRKQEKKRKSYPKNVVVLHQFPTEQRPSLSPFCLKLETWLRMADIKYEVCFEIYFLFNYSLFS